MASQITRVRSARERARGPVRRPVRPVRPVPQRGKPARMSPTLALTNTVIARTTLNRRHRAGFRRSLLFRRDLVPNCLVRNRIGRPRFIISYHTLHGYRFGRSARSRGVPLTIRTSARRFANCPRRGDRRTGGRPHRSAARQIAPGPCFSPPGQLAITLESRAAGVPRNQSRSASEKKPTGADYSARRG